MPPPPVPTSTLTSLATAAPSPSLLPGEPPLIKAHDSWAPAYITVAILIPLLFALSAALSVFLSRRRAAADAALPAAALERYRSRRQQRRQLRDLWESHPAAVADNGGQQQHANSTNANKEISKPRTSIAVTVEEVLPSTPVAHHKEREEEDEQGQDEFRTASGRRKWPPGQNPYRWTSEERRAREAESAAAAAAARQAPRYALASFMARDGARTHPLSSERMEEVDLGTPVASSWPVRPGEEVFGTARDKKRSGKVDGDARRREGDATRDLLQRSRRR